MPIIASAMAHRFHRAAVKSFPKGALLAELELGNGRSRGRLIEREKVDRPRIVIARGKCSAERQPQYSAACSPRRGYHRVLALACPRHEEIGLAGLGCDVVVRHARERGLGGCQLMRPGRAIDAVAQKGGVSSPCAGDFPNKVCGVRA